MFDNKYRNVRLFLLFILKVEVQKLARSDHLLHIKLYTFHLSTFKYFIIICRTLLAYKSWVNSPHFARFICIIKLK